MTHNLEEYQNKRHVRTVKWNVSYPIAKFYKNVLENMKVAPGTYFKIKPNSHKPQDYADRSN